MTLFAVAATALEHFSHFSSLPLREQLLAPFLIPDIAICALVLGLLLVYLEFNIPGKVVSGAVGTLLVTLSIFGLWQSHLSSREALLALGGTALLLLEAHRWRFGLFAIPGSIVLIFGLANLVPGSATQPRVHTATAVICGIVFSATTLALSSIAIRARRNKATGGPWI